MKPRPKAKHRFESHTAPLCRLLSNLPAVLATVQRICQARNDPVGAALKAWLEGLTAQELVQLGMLADVMDESLLLIRQVDCEQCDSAELGNYVQDYADRVQALILRRAIVETTGYTKLVTDLLADGKLKFFACGVARHLEPCQAESIDECFKNMEVWLRMALEVLRTEFPHYGIFSAFGVALLFLDN